MLESGNAVGAYVLEEQRDRHLAMLPPNAGHPWEWAGSDARARRDNPQLAE